VDAVPREPVSRLNSPVTGKNTGKNRENGFIESLVLLKEQLFQAF
jgi:hypothetical protein